MDEKLHLMAKLPSRHVTEAPHGALHRAFYYAGGLTRVRMVSATGGRTNAALQLPAIAHECGVKFDLYEVAEIFRRTPYIADLKPGGRYVAKDMFEAGGVPLLMRTLLDHGYPAWQFDHDGALRCREP